MHVGNKLSLSAAQMLCQTVQQFFWIAFLQLYEYSQIRQGNVNEHKQFKISNELPCKSKMEGEVMPLSFTRCVSARMHV